MLRVEGRECEETSNIERPTSNQKRTPRRYVPTFAFLASLAVKDVFVWFVLLSMKVLFIGANFRSATVCGAPVAAVWLARGRSNFPLSAGLQTRCGWFFRAFPVIT